MEDYLINAEVKYHQIKQDLLTNIENGEKEYSTEDVNNICDRLFIEELTNVFNAEDIMDDKIDKGIRQIFEILKSNNEFVSMFNEYLQKNIKYYYENSMEEEQKGMDEYLSEYMIHCLFSQKMFYITHKIVCQYLKNKMIDEELFNLFKIECDKNLLF
jgi:hypothetical protein